MSADEIISRCNKDFQKIINNPTPENIKDSFFNDRGCLRQLGKGVHDSSYTCRYCELLGYLTDLNPKTDKIKLHAGELKEETILIEKTNHPTLVSEWDDRVKNRHLFYKNKFDHNCDGFTVPDKYLVLDPWINDIIIEWILSDIYNDAGIQHVIPSAGAFVCRNVGYKLNIDSTICITDLKLTEKIVLSLFQQLGCLLRIIRHYNFVNPQSTINNLVYNENDANYIYRNLEIKSEFTIFLRGFNWSSIEWKNVRIVPDLSGRHREVDRAIKQNEFVINKKIFPKSVKVENENNEIHYEKLFQINSEMVSMLSVLRYSGLPVYAGVYDFYSHVVSLLSWKDLRDVVDSSQRLTDWVNALFPKKHFLLYWHSPEKTGLLTCPKKIATLLSEQYLYCDVFDRFLEA
jgi:hypothetical protein